MLTPIIDTIPTALDCLSDYILCKLNNEYVKIKIPAPEPSKGRGIALFVLRDQLEAYINNIVHENNKYWA